MSLEHAIIVAMVYVGVRLAMTTIVLWISRNDHEPKEQSIRSFIACIESIVFTLLWVAK